MTFASNVKQQKRALLFRANARDRSWNYAVTQIGIKAERRGDAVSRCGHRLSGIHYSSAMKPMFTDKPANVSASEHRCNVTTPNGRPLGCSVLRLNCKRRPIGNGGGDDIARNLRAVSWYRLVVNLRRRRIGEPARVDRVKRYFPGCRERTRRFC